MELKQRPQTKCAALLDLHPRPLARGQRRQQVIGASANSSTLRAEGLKQGGGEQRRGRGVGRKHQVEGGQTEVPGWSLRHATAFISVTAVH